MKKKAQIKEQNFEGISVSPGIAIGPVVCMTETIHIPERTIQKEDIDSEIERLKQAIEATKKELETLSEKIHSDIGKSQAEIFEVHKLILEDESLLEKIVSRIKQEKKNIEYIFYVTMNEYRKTFEALNDQYFRERLGLPVSAKESGASAL